MEETKKNQQQTWRLGDVLKKKARPSWMGKSKWKLTLVKVDQKSTVDQSQQMVKMYFLFDFFVNGYSMENYGWI